MGGGREEEGLGLQTLGEASSRLRLATASWPRTLRATCARSGTRASTGSGADERATMATEARARRRLRAGIGTRERASEREFKGE